MPNDIMHQIANLWLVTCMLASIGDDKSSPVGTHHTRLFLKSLKRRKKTLRILSQWGTCLLPLSGCFYRSLKQPSWLGILSSHLGYPGRDGKCLDLVILSISLGQPCFQLFWQVVRLPPEEIRSGNGPCACWNIFGSSNGLHSYLVLQASWKWFLWKCHWQKKESVYLPRCES